MALRKNHYGHNKYYDQFSTKREMFCLNLRLANRQVTHDPNLPISDTDNIGKIRNNPNNEVLQSIPHLLPSHAPARTSPSSFLFRRSARSCNLLSKLVSRAYEVAKDTLSQAYQLKSVNYDLRHT